MAGTPPYRRTSTTVVWGRVHHRAAQFGGSIASMASRAWFVTRGWRIALSVSSMPVSASLIMWGYLSLPFGDPGQANSHPIQSTRGVMNLWCVAPRSLDLEPWRQYFGITRFAISSQKLVFAAHLVSVILATARIHYWMPGSGCVETPLFRSPIIVRCVFKLPCSRMMRDLYAKMGVIHGTPRIRFSLA